jgi:hypothetical protein
MPLTLFTRKRPQPDSRAVPIVLGITGHGDVRETDLPRLRQVVASIFESFARCYHHTPLLLLSSLAQPINYARLWHWKGTAGHRTAAFPSRGLSAVVLVRQRRSAPPVRWAAARLSGHSLCRAAA